MRFRRPKLSERASSEKLLLGAVEALVADCAAAVLRAERAEELAASYAAQLRRRRARETNMVDGRPVIDELARLAGTALPEAVDTAVGLMHERAELTARAQRSEHEAELLAHAIVGDPEPDDFDDGMAS